MPFGSSIPIAVFRRGRAPFPTRCDKQTWSRQTWLRPDNPKSLPERLVVHIDDGKSYDADILDVMIPEPGAIYVMDRGYRNFARLHRLGGAGAFFVVRRKIKQRARRITSRPVDRMTGIIYAQTVVMTVRQTARTYPAKLHRVRYLDPDTGKIKQHLRFNSFFGNTENAVKTQIWIAVCVYVLIAIVKKLLALGGQSLHNPAGGHD